MRAAQARRRAAQDEGPTAVPPVAGVECVEAAGAGAAGAGAADAFEAFVAGTEVAEEPRAVVAMALDWAAARAGVGSLRYEPAPAAEAAVVLYRSRRPSGKVPLDVAAHLLRLGLVERLTLPVDDAGGVLVLDGQGRPLPGEAGLDRYEEVGRQVGRVVRAAERVLELERFASQDGLTGLTNRRAFDDLLARVLAVPTDPGPVALALIDIDDLKLVNDAHGHARGDQVIRRAAEALREVAWRVPGVVAARVGGDEFALVVVGPHAAEAGIVVEQVRADLLAGDPVVHVSAGIAIALQRPVDVHTMYAAADASQYTAKRGGRSRVAAPVVVEPGADPVADLAGAGPAEPPGPSERRRRRVAGGEAATQAAPQAGPDAGPDAAR